MSFLADFLKLFEIKTKAFLQHRNVPHCSNKQFFSFRLNIFEFNGARRSEELNCHLVSYEKSPVGNMKISENPFSLRRINSYFINLT
jgi:hypothetical protein